MVALMLNTRWPILALIGTLLALRPTDRHLEVRAEDAGTPTDAARELADDYRHAGLSPQEAVEAMRLPDGFSVVVCAAEPDVRQPIAMAIDDRGRVWVAEAYEYPLRAPEGKGRDRILIFEDEDGDGRFDSRKIFAENLNLVSGLEVGFGGVWVGAAPHLLFLPDRDGDDRPDGPPQILLDGWGYQDTHETLNAFIWGPDGWLYGCHGVFTHSLVGKPGTPQERRVPLNAAIWRYHPTRHVFEVFAHGTSNPWGVDFNDLGQAFCTACVIPHLYHVIQGARYERQAGQHFNQHTYDDIRTIADHRHYLGAKPHLGNDRSGASGGGHAHCGAMIYLGAAWPNRYRNKIFMNNIHGQRINMDVLVPQGSGYVGSHGPDLLLTGDRASQIVNMRYGPDGQVYVIDWYDMQACHSRDPAVHDRSNGRVYKVIYGQPEAARVDLRALDNAQLVELTLHDNDWYVRHARRLLQERSAELSVDARHRLQDIAERDPRTDRRLRGIWALHVTGGIPQECVDRLLSDSDPYVRAWTIQLSGDQESPAGAEWVRRLEAMARNDPSPVVRLYVASAAARLPLGDRWQIVEGLASHAEDTPDHNLPLMIWYAAEPLVEADPERALALSLTAGDAMPLVREFMLRRIAGLRGSSSLAVLVDCLPNAADPAVQRAILDAMRASLRGQRNTAPPPKWSAVYDRLSQSDDPSIHLQADTLAALFGDARAAQALRKRVCDPAADVADRKQALETLLATRDERLADVLCRLLSDAPLRDAALRGLAHYDHPATPPAILAVYPQLTPSEKRSALATLCARGAYAEHLLDAIAEGDVAGADLTADLVRQLRNLNHPRIDDKLNHVWGTVRDPDEGKAHQIAAYRRMLSSRPLHVPDLSLGRWLFVRACQQCHTLFGVGGRVGPNLTGSNRAQLDYVLANLVDPSAVMAHEYRSEVIATSDGRVITGIVRAENTSSLTIQTENETLVLPVGDIVERKPSGKSMMPDDLLQHWSEREIRSLIAYLASPRQVPVRATGENENLLFDGVDLSGWSGDERLWSVDKGQIIGRSSGLRHNAFLISDLAAEDFRLSLEVKLVGDDGNSGIQFRSRSMANGDVAGYQADIGPGWWGKLYEEHGRGVLGGPPADAPVRPGRWNRYTIVAQDDRIQTWINGRPCVDIKDPQGARSGIFALQIHSGEATEVRFRNLQLQVRQP